MPESITYVDETGIDSYLYREYAYAPKGEKIYERISGRKFKRTNIVAAKLGNKIIAPMQYEGTTDSTLFEFWFEKCLLSCLSDKTVIVMDNAAFHRKHRLLEIAKNHKKTLLFLPPYSPELNPIEKFWSWLKQYLRKNLHIFDSLDDAICSAFQVV